ncbi:MAG TPA: hypothetical protein VF192_05255 [Longimicrobiales bacterium]
MVAEAYHGLLFLGYVVVWLVIAGIDVLWLRKQEVATKRTYTVRLGVLNGAVMALVVVLASG